jgi:hypothetical protein
MNGQWKLSIENCSWANCFIYGFTDDGLHPQRLCILGYWHVCKIGRGICLYGYPCCIGLPSRLCCISSKWAPDRICTQVMDCITVHRATRVASFLHMQHLLLVYIFIYIVISPQNTSEFHSRHWRYSPPRCRASYSPCTALDADRILGCFCQDVFLQLVILCGRKSGICQRSCIV